jgi:hypothetical protein
MIVNAGPYKGFPINANLSAYLRVKITSGYLALAGSTDVELGVTSRALQVPTGGIGQSNFGDVTLRTAEGTVKMIAAGAIAAQALVYAAASGKVANAGTVLVGRAMTAASADGNELEVLRIGEASNAAANGGTTASAFEVDSDSAIPKIALASQTGGTGDFTTTLKPESTLSADNAIIVPEADGDTLAAVALAQTLTNKTLTSPVLNTPTVKDLTEVVTATNAITAAETGSVFFLNSATEFVSTLPTPAAGLKYSFIVSAAPSGASYTIVTASSSNLIKGNVVTSEDAAADWEVTGGDTISFVDGQAVAGDRVDVISDGTNWFAYGRCKVAAGITITTAS